MIARRLGIVMVGMLGLVLMLGAPSAGAAGPTRVLKLQLSHVQGQWTGPYWNRHTTPETPPPVGEQVNVTGLVVNDAVLFGKATGARVGRILLECTVLAESDGLCTGIVHVPDGFFTIAGNGPFSKATLRHYAITGGSGAYANARGEMTTNRTGGAKVVVYA
jgi:hypothetical protein